MNKKIPPKDDSLESLQNIGKVIAGKLQKIGIRSKEEFLACDPYEIFDKLIAKVDSTLCRCALASIVGANANILWHVITKQAAKKYEQKHPDFEWGKC